MLCSKWVKSHKTISNNSALCVSFVVRLLSESSQEEPSATTEEEEEESCGVLGAQVLSLSQVVRDNSAEFIKHVHGSHVVRTLLHVLAGCLGPPRTESRPGTHTQIHCLA